MDRASAVRGVFEMGGKACANAVGRSDIEEVERIGIEKIYACSLGEWVMSRPRMRWRDD